MAQGKAEDLQAFAKRIETKLRKGNGEAMENLVCRLLTGADVKVAAFLANKWVEWRYGRPKETHEITGKDGAPIEHTIKFGDGTH